MDYITAVQSAPLPSIFALSAGVKKTTFTLSTKNGKYGENRMRMPMSRSHQKITVTPMERLLSFSK